MKKKKNQAHFLILNSHSEFLQKVYKLQESQDQGQARAPTNVFLEWINSIQGLKNEPWVQTMSPM